MKKCHCTPKTIYDPKSSDAITLLGADGSTLLTDKDAILERWTEHFNSVLNRPSSISDDAIYRLPQMECNALLDEFPPVIETKSYPTSKLQVPRMSIRLEVYPWQRT